MVSLQNSEKSNVKRKKITAASSGVSDYRRSLTNFTANGGEFNPEKLSEIVRCSV